MEIQNFGWNILTLSAVAVIVFTIWQAWGLWKQYRTIVELKSGQSVSVTKFASTTTFFLLSGLYGYYIGSVLIPFTSIILTTMNLPVLYALKKYKGYTRKEKKWLMLFLITIPLMVIVPFKEVFYMAFAFARMVPFASQPLEMFREKKVGAVEIRLFWAYLTGALFWVTFYFAFGDPVLKTLSILNTSILAVTVFLYYWYRETKEVTARNPNLNSTNV